MKRNSLLRLSLLLCIVASTVVQHVHAQVETKPAAPAEKDATKTKPLSKKEQERNQQLDLAQEYYRRDEWVKAAAIFKDLADDKVLIPTIYDKYVNSLKQSLNWTELEKFYKQVQRKYPEEALYAVDFALYYQNLNKPDKANKLIEELKKQLRDNPAQTKLAAAHALKNAQPLWAKIWLLSTREYLKQPDLFSSELAEVYKAEGDNNQMFAEVLQMADREGQPMYYVISALQSLISKPEEYQALERQLLVRLNSRPTHNGYTELLLWCALQQKDFQGAFLQARALDRRMGLEAQKSMEVAYLSAQNKDYGQAITIYEYVRDNWSDKPVAYSAARQLLQVREALIKQTYPINKEEVRKLLSEYRLLLGNKLGYVNKMENLRAMALLYGHYLGQTDSAMTLLHEVVNSPMANQELKDKAKMDLADFYIIKNEPWESTLLYSQIEKTQKEQPLGHEAKLRNAKLSYYKGEFLLAQEHLDVLKLATSRETANDALDLGLRIQNNTILDSASPALVAFSKIELLLFQNQVDAALTGLTQMLKDYPKDPIRDDALWLRSKTYRKINEPQKALADLDSLLKYHADDTYADDAQYTKGLILEEDLGATEKAMQAYEQVLKLYPASVFAADARKRFRTLRGDSL